MALTPTASQLAVLQLQQAMLGQAAGTTAMAAALPTFTNANAYAKVLFDANSAWSTLDATQAYTKLVTSLAVGTSATTADINALVAAVVAETGSTKLLKTIPEGIALLTVAFYNFATSTTSNVWTDAAKQFANKVTVDAYYTLDKGNNAPSTTASAAVTANPATVTDALAQIGGTGTAISATFQLTAAAETFVGGNGADTFYAVVGNNVGSQDQTTLNSGDSMVGGSGDDIMYVNMTGNYNGGAMIHGIETLRLGTAGVVAFDYNVNEGQPQVADVTTLVADQINVGEALTVNNIIKTSGTLPTLSWENDSVNAAAGTVALNYRAAQVSGTTDQQTVVLKNVSNGILNVGAGIEQINISGATGSSRDTLAYSGNGNADADLISGTNLTKVVMTGGVELGKAASVISATDGRVNRTAGSADDLGLTGASSAANLLSVGQSVTEVDASGMTANANVRFTGAVNAKFTGGTGNDYVEAFRSGNFNFNGGAGNDTFAFTNTTTNSSFGANDTMTGGAGTDTLQLGLNGAGTYNLSVTEFNNVTGVDVLDLRGAADNVAIYSNMVATADAGTFIVRTDKIVQSSDTDPANSLTGNNNGLEKGSVHEVYLNQLSNNQAIQFIGGSGSDQLVLNNATFSSAVNLNGGAKDSNQSYAAGQLLYDTLTVVDNGAVIDNQDLSNVSNFQGIIFSKPNTSAVAQELLVLTDAFLNANTQANDLTYTAINDMYFQIGTARAGAGAALTGGDTVTIDVTGVTATTARRIDVTSLTNAGVTIVWRNNGATVAQPAFVAADPTGNGNDVIRSAADIAANTGNTLTFTGTSGNTTTGFEIQGNLLATAFDDTINIGGLVLNATSVVNGSGHVTGDTLNMTAGANIAAANVTNVEIANITGGVTMTAAQHNAFTTITAAGAADAITLTTAATVTGAAAIEGYTIVEGSTFTVGTLAQTVTADATAANTTIVYGNGAYTGAVTGFETLDQISLVTGSNIAGINAGATLGADQLLITGATTANTMTVTQWNVFNTAPGAITAAGAANTVTLNSAAAATASANAAVENYVLAGTTGNQQLQFGSGLADAVKNTMTVTCSGSTDRIVLDNAAYAASSLTSGVTINGFNVATDQISSRIAGTDTHNGAFYNNLATALTSVTTVASGSVIEVSADVYQYTAVTNTAAVFAAINNLLGNGLAGGAVVTAGTDTFIVYGAGGTTAAIYQGTVAANVITGLELVGTVNSITANSLTGSNFF